MPKGNLTITASVFVPKAATDRVKAAFDRSKWVSQTVTIACIEDVEHADAVRVVGKFRTKNPGLDIRGEWVGRLGI